MSNVPRLSSASPGGYYKSQCVAWRLSAARSLARVQTLKMIGGSICKACIRGRHACDEELCLCLCNDADFPWPPKG